MPRGNITPRASCNGSAQARRWPLLGGDQQALLQPAPGLPDGALLAVEMTRGPIPEPGRWKLPVVRPAPHIEAAARAGLAFQR